MATHLAYPVKVRATLDKELSRWLWLVKWFLAIPHYIVLAFLWTTFFFLSVFAFFSILFTGRYPRSIFEFNVGVLRWSWRVGYYATSALGTDRYPPFTMREDAEFPAHLEIEYPGELSRGLVLVKWWLLAIPHYIVVGLLMGGMWWISTGEDWETAGFGLIGILTFIAGASILFTGRYPHGLFDLLLGLNRWVLRVAAYAGLMTDRYPPFRLDMGGDEPTDEPTSADPSASQAPPASEADGMTGGWTMGPIVALIVGTMLAFPAAGLLGGSGIAFWADTTRREDGFITSPDESFASAAAAIITAPIDLQTETPGWFLPTALFGDARVRILDATEPIFVGVALTRDVERYLAGVSRASIGGLHDSDHRDIPASLGAEDAEPPGQQTFWEASEEGSPPLSVTWPVDEGRWSLVFMNRDGSGDVSFRGEVGAEIPMLGAIAVALLIAGLLLAFASIALIRGAIKRAR